MERKKFRDSLLLGCALLGVWFLLQRFDALAGFLHALWVILSPFVLGAVFAFILNVPMRFLENRVLGAMNRVPWLKKVRRPVALVLVLVLLMVLVYLLMSLIVPELVATLETIARLVPSFIQQLDERLAPYEIQIGDFLNDHLKMPSGAELSARLDKMLDLALKGVMFSGSVIGSAYQGILSGFFTLMFVIYFLLGKERLAAQTMRLMRAYLKPGVVERIVRVTSLAQRTFSSFITGQCLEAVILGALFFVAMSIFKMPYVLLISVFIAVTALIPVIGAWMGCIVGAFLILVSSPMQALGFLALFLILQQLEGNLIYPRVMGTAIGLPSIWVLLAVVLGEGLMGVVGMLLFIPLTSVGYQLLRDAVDERIRRQNCNPME